MEENFRQRIINYLGYGFVVVFLLMLVLVFAKKGIYSPQMGVNFIVVGDNSTSLVLMRPQEGVLTWVKLPGNLSIKIVGSEAVYPLSSLWKFGLLEKNPYIIVGESLSGSIGVLLPRVIKIEGENTPENLLGQLYRLNLATNFSVRDRILLRKDLMGSVNSKKIIEIDIPKAATSKVQDPDGKEFLEINSVVNLWTKNKFVFDVLLGEGKNIKITNLTSVKGAGLLLSRQLESSGMRVVELSSKEQFRPHGKGCVYKLNKEAIFSNYLLEKYVGCKRMVGETDVKDSSVGEIWLL